ncbi:SDR family oxidoreductase [Streptomyces sp. 7R007]
MPTAVITVRRPAIAGRRPSCCTPAATRSRSPRRIPSPSRGRSPSSPAACSSSDPTGACSPTPTPDVGADAGSIVLTVGIGSRRGTPGAMVGAAARGTVPAMLPPLALELAPRRIHVNAVSPGATDTPALNKLRAPESGRDAMRSKPPSERFGTSQEVAEAVAFLASDAAGHLTGQDITVAGGYGLGA